MIKRDNKGFMLMETLLVSVFIATTLIFLFVQFQKVRDSYDVSFSYNTVNGLYGAKSVLTYLEENGLANTINGIKSGSAYLDLSGCPTSYLTEQSYCMQLYQSLNIKKVIFTASNTSGVVSSLNSMTISNKFKSFIRNIKNDTSNNYRLLIEYNDETYATIIVKSAVAGASYQFSYSGGVQTFTAPNDGNYQIQLWGARGGNFVGVKEYPKTYYGGKGAYTTGNIDLKKGDVLYIYVGEKGSDSNGFERGTFNGGGGLKTSESLYGRTGGGATDVRLTGGNWDNFDSLKSRIMVAAGGGGANNRNDQDNVYRYGAGDGGAGGTLKGIDGTTTAYKAEGSIPGYANHGVGYGATQTAGGIYKTLSLSNEVLSTQTTGVFGVGGGQEGTTGQSGGGGGYYGGSLSYHGGAGGGSSFISGYSGCNAIDTASTASNIIHTGQAKHYSGRVFTNMSMIGGNSSMPTYQGSGSMIGNDGNGYAIITAFS